jgi:hypothetical protein
MNIGETAKAAWEAIFVRVICRRVRGKRGWLTRGFLKRLVIRHLLPSRRWRQNPATARRSLPQSS